MFVHFNPFLPKLSLFPFTEIHCHNLVIAGRTVSTVHEHWPRKAAMLGIHEPQTVSMQPSTLAGLVQNGGNSQSHGN